ncbi:MAG: hypothetical protein PHC64_04665 [Candidatus Gastranaerophilales bacterium]|nr:hypothetical protein [Candidatus Gastranaerophilales bacterium]
MPIEKWNRIVNCYNKYYNSPEKTIQIVWESIFAELLGYSRLDGDIDRQRNITIGSAERAISDIILCDGDKDLFIVELKRHNLSFCGDKQLLSYLKLLHNDIGILVCDKIYIFDYDYNKEDDEQSKIEIEFIKDNPDGIKFVELFSKNSFEKDVIKNFIHQKIKFEQNISHIKNEITNELILHLLQQHFTDKYYKFSTEEFEQAVNSFNITILLKNAVLKTAEDIAYDTKLKCKKCNGNNFVKAGIINGVQRYKCKNCGYTTTNHLISEEMNKNGGLIDEHQVVNIIDEPQFVDIIDHIDNSEPEIEEDLVITNRQQFINTVKKLFSNIPKAYIQAYECVLTDADGTIYDYNKLYNLLITQYSSNRAPAPAWFAKKISEVVFPDKKSLLGIKDNTDIYNEIGVFIQEWTEKNNGKRKMPIALVKDFCVRKRICSESKFKKWFSNLCNNFVSTNAGKYIIEKNQMYVWLVKNYTQEEEIEDACLSNNTY